MPRICWERYALELAKVAATRSEDPYVKVGACALRDDHSVISVGYNGAPAGITIDWANRDERRKRVLHAECNTLRYCKPGECKLLVVTMAPCIDCLKLIAANRIPVVIYDIEYDKSPESFELTKEFRINLVQIDELEAIYASLSKTP